MELERIAVALYNMVLDMDQNDYIDTAEEEVKMLCRELEFMRDKSYFKAVKAEGSLMEETKKIYNLAYAALQQNNTEILKQTIENTWKNTPYYDFACDMALIISNKTMTNSVYKVMEAGWKFLCELTKTNTYAGTRYLTNIHTQIMEEKYVKSEPEFTKDLIFALKAQAQRRGEEIKLKAKISA